jgi:hypothetical protein
MIKKSFKTYGVFFNAVYNGNATALEMPTDVSLKNGDLVLFQEWTHNGGFTGREIVAKVTFVYRNERLKNGQYSFFCFRITNLQVENQMKRKMDESELPYIERLKSIISEKNHQVEVDLLFRKHIKKQISDVCYTLPFESKAKIEKILTIFDKKFSAETVK